MGKCGGRNKAAITRKVQERIAESLHENFIKVCQREDKRDDPIQINGVLWVLWPHT